MERISGASQLGASLPSHIQDGALSHSSRDTFGLFFQFWANVVPHLHRWGRGGVAGWRGTSNSHFIDNNWSQFGPQCCSGSYLFLLFCRSPMLETDVRLRRRRCFKASGLLFWFPPPPPPFLVWFSSRQETSGSGCNQSVRESSRVTMAGINTNLANPSGKRHNLEILSSHLEASKNTPPQPLAHPPMPRHISVEQGHFPVGSGKYAAMRQE